MDVAAVKRHCAAYPGAGMQVFAAPANILVYTVGGRRFAYFKTSTPEQWRFSVRTAADRFLELTDVPGIRPARYFARFHWVTIVDVRSVPETWLRELVDWSYADAFARLPKRHRREIATRG